VFMGLLTISSNLRWFTFNVGGSRIFFAGGRTRFGVVGDDGHDEVFRRHEWELFENAALDYLGIYDEPFGYVL